MFDPKEFFDLMIFEAEKNGLDLMDIIREAGIARASVFQWKNGISFPSNRMLKKLKLTMDSMK